MKRIRTNPQNLWQNLKDLGMPSKSRNTSTNIGLKNNHDAIIFYNTGDRFNHFFCNVADNLSKKMAKTPLNKEDRFALR